MRVLLLRPRYSSVVEITPPLGLLYLTSILRRELRAEVKVLDLLAKGETFEQAAQIARSYEPDAIGFSALSAQADSVRDLSRHFRQSVPKAVQILGGAYGTTQPEKALLGTEIDYCVLGEGERTMPDLLGAIEKGGAPDGVSGIAYRSAGAIVRTPPRAPIEDLDSIPFPAWDAVDVGLYGRLPRIGTICKYKTYFSIFTSRGCPYQCAYCHNIFGKAYRCRSVENVLDEIGVLTRDFGMREIQIIDDTFNLKRDRVVRFFREYCERGFTAALSFPNGLRGDLIDEEIVRLMKQAGVYKVSIAIESGNARVQETIGKKLDLAKARKSIEMLARHGIVVHGFFMMGFPGETVEDIQATARYARKSRLHSASFFYVQPLPGSSLHTHLADQRGEAQSLDGLQWSSYYDLRNTEFALCTATAKQLRRVNRSASIRFYANPLRLVRILRDLPNKRQLFYLARLAATRVLFPGFEKRLLTNWRKTALAEQKS